MREYYVYMMTNQNNRVLYIGITNNIIRRISEHKQRRVKGFTAKYNVNKLVYLETFSNVNEAIQREKQLKGWIRSKKNNLIESKNPKWEEVIL